MHECIQCGDLRDREHMISLNLATPQDERPQPDELVCVRCASVAMKGGPSNMTQEELAEHGIVVGN
jgi:hypothetical protein